MEKRKRTLEEEYGITGKGGAVIEIPVKGSISLLALGYRGLMAWRAKRIEEERKRNKNEKNET